ncbi:hypothetical protein FQR65_LT09912 [Abscondita terminalis]|nr:hypothetical protein FQR65_LT09912 [Abscondita terminalis]
MITLICLASMVASVFSQHSGHSYYKFIGPVSGAVQQVHVNGIHGPTIDYIAKPDYAYSYGIDDSKTGNSHSRQESRIGDSVNGEYTVLEADGTMRVVQYTSDPHNGFQAQVHYKRL